MCIIFIFLISAYCLAKKPNSSEECIIATPDSQTSSPASVTGNIKKINLEKKNITIESGKKLFEVNLIQIDQSNIFSQYGGTINLNEFKINDRLEIWIKACEKPKKNKISPITIRIYKN